jgi:glycosyltransferase involved in cell wall biosynthesis
VEAYVAKCLDSVLSDKIKDYEIIVVNDGSTDSSKSIVQDYVNRYPHIFRLISIENSGQGQARNVGIDAAQGEFLYFIDSDDYLIPGGIEAIYKLLEQDFDICIFDSIAVNMSGQELEYRHGCKRSDNISLAQYPELLLENPDVWNKIFRRSLFVENNIRFTPRVWFEDLRTVPKLYAFTDRIIYSPQALHRYLQRPNSVTNTQKVARNLEIIPAVDEIIGFYAQLGRYDELKAVLEYLAFYCQFLTSSVRANLAQWNSPVQDELLKDFLCKFPDYKLNPYVKSISRQHKLLTFLLMHRLRLSVHVLMKLNNRLKNKQL